ncbi:F-box/LRR-repeat protein 4-like [Apis florea]|uniref:F-box/LRR-repeat protein 4-like n=1 Tax=Apis florea TaxID=7463 RepID=UPI0012FEE17B|nr:F-box/LRR-repeat protein 4-like [Apis florea]
MTNKYIWHNLETSNQFYSTLQNVCKFRKKHLLEKYNQCDLQKTMINSNIYKLNNDCLILIFLYLPIVDRIRIERVCKRWQKISQKSWHNIKKLDLRNYTWGFASNAKLKQINTVILNKVLSRCEIIDVSYLQVPSTGITSVINNCHNIKKLSLDCIYLFDTDLEKLFKVNQQLQFLKLVDIKISGKCLLHLPSNTIKEIIIKRCDYVCDDDVAEAITRLNNLKHFIISECFDTLEKTTKAIGKYSTSLETLEIVGKSSMLQFNGISHVTTLSNLKNLKVSANWFICNSILCKLSSHCQQLIYLDLSDVPGHFITDHTLAAIEKFTKLEILITRDLYQVTSNGLLHLYNLKQLVCQECSFFDITISKFIQHSFQLKILDLSGCRNITNVTLRRAVTATNYRTNNIILNLFIGGTAVNLETFKEVSPFLQIYNTDSRYKEIFPFHPDSILI